MGVRLGGICLWAGRGADAGRALARAAVAYARARDGRVLPLRGCGCWRRVGVSGDGSGR